MKKYFPDTLLFIFMLIVISVQGHAQVFADWDHHVDLNKYKTYAWIAPGDSVLNRERPEKLFGGFIMYTVNKELKSKGMAVDTIRPLVVFVFHTKVEDKTRYSQSPTLSVGVGVAGPGYYVGGMAPVAGGKITESPYQIGSLSFEMFDTQTGHLVWTGGDKRDFAAHKDDIQKLIVSSVKKIFKKLPIKYKSK